MEDTLGETKDFLRLEIHVFICNQTECLDLLNQRTGLAAIRDFTAWKGTISRPCPKTILLPEPKIFRHAAILKTWRPQRQIEF